MNAKIFKSATAFVDCNEELTKFPSPMTWRTFKLSLYSTLCLFIRTTKQFLKSWLNHSILFIFNSWTSIYVIPLDISLKLILSHWRADLLERRHEIIKVDSSHVLHLYPQLNSNDDSHTFISRRFPLIFFVISRNGPMAASLHKLWISAQLYPIIVESLAKTHFQQANRELSHTLTHFYQSCNLSIWLEV